MHGGQLETGPERDRGGGGPQLFAAALQKRRGEGFYARGRRIITSYIRPPYSPPKGHASGAANTCKTPPSRQRRPAGRPAQPRMASPGRHRPGRAPAQQTSQQAAQPRPAEPASQEPNAHARARFKTRARAGELYRARARGSSRGAAFVCGFGSAKFF